MGFVNILLLAVLACRVSAEVDRACDTTTDCESGLVCEQKLCKIGASGTCTVQQTTLAMPTTATAPPDATTTAGVNPTTTVPAATTGGNTQTTTQAAPSATVPDTTTQPAPSTTVPDTTTQPAPSTTVPDTTTQPAPSTTVPDTTTQPAPSTTVPDTTTQPAPSTTVPDTTTQPAPSTTVPDTTTPIVTNPLESTTTVLRRKRQTSTAEECVSNASCLSVEGGQLTCACNSGYFADGDGFCKDSAAGSNHKASVWVALGAVTLLLMK